MQEDNTRRPSSHSDLGEGGRRELNWRAPDGAGPCGLLGLRPSKEAPAAQAHCGLDQWPQRVMAQSGHVCKVGLTGQYQGLAWDVLTFGWETKGRIW